MTGSEPAIRPAEAVIDTEALRHNLGRVRQNAPRARVMAVVKADAYGHGLIPVARALASHVEALAVATCGEGLALRRAGIETPLVVLHGMHTVEEWKLALQATLVPVLHDPAQLPGLIEAAGSAGAPRMLWFKLDTGMHRLGLGCEQVAALLDRLRALPGDPQIGWMTHFAEADDPRSSFTTEQIERFRRCLRDRPGPRSLANSAAILAHPDSHADWVRPGIMLYGASPLAGKLGPELGLRPAMRLQAPLLAVRELRKGEGIGYGRAWQAPRDMTVGIVAAGYGDGYPRHAPSGTPLGLRGREVALIGRVSMDMLAIDLSGIERPRPGEPVELWGETVPVDRVAAASGTIGYELLCAVAGRTRHREATTGFSAPDT